MHTSSNSIATLAIAGGEDGAGAEAVGASLTKGSSEDIQSGMMIGAGKE